MIRPYQEKAVNEIEEAWSSGVKSVCFQLPTGGGKSHILRQIIENHYCQRKTIYVIAHRKSLVYQLSRHLDEIKIKHGIIQANHPYIRHRVQVCSLPTLVRRNNLPEPEIIIVDEFHHVKSKSYMDLIKKWDDAKILGVTATPRRTDGKPLSDVCQKLILGPDMPWLIDNNFLSDYDYFAPDTIDLDLKGLKTSMGDYEKKELFKRMDKPKIYGCAIEHYQQYSDKLPAIVACVNIQHCENVAEEFRSAGYDFRAIHSKMGKVEEYIKLLAHREIHGLTFADIIGEGVDIPVVNTLIGLRPTQSQVIFLQHIGRVLRKAPGKDKAIILDHVENWSRHGLPKMDQKWSLEAFKKKKKGKNILRRCPNCMRPVLLENKKCPYCEYAFFVEIKEDGEKVTKGPPEQVKGKLIKIQEWKKQQNLIIDIARNANTLKKAILIGQAYGKNHKQVWYIWTHVLKNKQRGIV